MIEIKITNPSAHELKEIENLCNYLLSSVGARIVKGDVNEPQLNTTPEMINDLQNASLKNFGAESFTNTENNPQKLAETFPKPIFNNNETEPAINNTELDVLGNEWNEEIHASNKAKNKDGTWRLKRVAATKKVKETIAEPVETSNNEEIAKPSDTLNTVVEDAKPVQEQKSFSDLMALITRGVTNGHIKRDRVNEIVTSFGVPSLALLPTMPDQINPIYKHIEGLTHAA